MTSASDPAVWDRYAASFDAGPDHGLLDPGTRAAWRRLLLPCLPPVPALVADLGCGTGTLALLLAEAGYGVDALDFSPAMVRHASVKLQGTGVVPRLGDASAPGLADGSVDAVLCRHLLWALPDPEAAVAAWARAVRPGGRFVLVEGRWSTGAGLTAGECRALLAPHAAHVEVIPLSDPILWGGPVEDERHLVTGAV